MSIPGCPVSLRYSPSLFERNLGCQLKPAMMISAMSPLAIYSLAVHIVMKEIVASNHDGTSCKLSCFRIYLFWTFDPSLERTEHASQEQTLGGKKDKGCEPLKMFDVVSELKITRPTPISRVRDINNLRWLLWTQDDSKWAKTSLKTENE